MPGDFRNISAEAERRWQGLSAGDAPWVRIGSALCGQAAGCDAVVQAVEAALSSTGGAVQVSRVGCIGLCYAEPLLDVQLPGGPRVFYGNVTPETAAEIVREHVVGGAPVERLALGYLKGPEGAMAPPALPGTLQDLDSHPLRAVETKIALRNAGNIDPGDIYQYVANGGYHALHRALTEMEPADNPGTGQRFGPARKRWRGLPHGHQVAVPGGFQRAGEIHPLQLRGRLTRERSTTKRSWKATRIP